MLPLARHRGLALEPLEHRSMLSATLPTEPVAEPELAICSIAEPSEYVEVCQFETDFGSDWWSWEELPDEAYDWAMDFESDFPMEFGIELLDSTATLDFFTDVSTFDISDFSEEDWSGDSWWYWEELPDEAYWAVDFGSDFSSEFEIESLDSTSTADFFTDARALAFAQPIAESGTPRDLSAGLAFAMLADPFGESPSAARPKRLSPMPIVRS